MENYFESENRYEMSVFKALVALVVIILVHELGHLLFITIYGRHYILLVGSGGIGFAVDTSGLTDLQEGLIFLGGYMFQVLLFIIWKFKKTGFTKALMIINIMAILGNILTTVFFGYGDLQYILYLL